MITKKSILALVLAFICFACVCFIYPLTEQYQGATGYIYENGLLFNLLYICLLVFGIMLIVYSFVEMYEVET